MSTTCKRKESKSEKLKKIYTPHIFDSDDEWEDAIAYDEPAKRDKWRRHFKSDVLLDRYEPTHQLGMLPHHKFSTNYTLSLHI